jgi:hypothetical protein
VTHEPDAGFAALMEAQYERELNAGAVGALLPLVADTWEEW